MSRIILFFIAVSLPLGDQLNAIGINVSLLYTISIVIATLYLPFKKGKTQIPIEYKVFYFFILLHCILTYLPNIDLLTKHRLIRMYGKILPGETQGIVLIRYFIYLLSPCVILKYVNDRDSLLSFSKTYICSLFSSVVLCSVFNIVSSYENRFSGGFHDPNTFGGMSVIAFFLSLYLSKCNYKLYKYLSIVFIGFIIASGSRSAAISLIIGILYLLNRYGLSIKQFVILCVSIAVVFIIMHSDFYIVERFSNISESRDGDLRTVIWLHYIKSWETYFFSGVGAGCVLEVVKDSDSTFSTHNQYLLQLVQFGIIGLLLFLWCLYKNIRFFTKYSRINNTIIPIASLQLCSLVLFFFSDYENTRELVILTTLYFILYNYRKSSLRHITLTR